MAQALMPSSPHRFLSASSSEGLLGSVLRPEVAVPWSRGVREELAGPKSSRLPRPSTCQGWPEVGQRVGRWVGLHAHPRNGRGVGLLSSNFASQDEML